MVANLLCIEGYTRKDKNRLRTVTTTLRLTARLLVLLATVMTEEIKSLMVIANKIPTGATTLTEMLVTVRLIMVAVEEGERMVAHEQLILHMLVVV